MKASVSKGLITIFLKSFLRLCTLVNMIVFVQNSWLLTVNLSGTETTYVLRQNIKEIMLPN